MAQIYADENVSFKIVDQLRRLGHDALTALEDGKANQNISDAAVLTRSTELNRIVLTNNRDDYHHLHDDTNGNHAGIITFTDDEIEALSKRIHDKLEENPDMKGKLIKIVKPNRKK
ncbi:MAG TPA: DUF5615 family PIN-like protein [Gemmata sp.]|nr:DUF5615 family PIN-like protein [Gemmata sp.]